jgi:hypothetical protein
MNTRALFIVSLLVVGCGGRTSADGANSDAAGVSPGSQDAGADADADYDASAELHRPDCPYVAWQSACESMAQTYCAGFVPCFLAQERPVANNGEHYTSVSECVNTHVHFCPTRQPRYAMCTSNLQACLDAYQHASCDDYIIKNAFERSFEDVCGDDYLSGPIAPPPK